MIKTEKKHWVNGYQIRGGYFKTYTFNIKSLGVMFCINGHNIFKSWLSFYKLIK